MADLDVRAGLGIGLTLLLLLGVVLRDGEGDQPVGDDRAEGAVGASGEPFVDPTGTQSEGEGLGGERGHRGGAVATERLVPCQDVKRWAAVGGDSGVTRGGVQDRPLVGKPELHQGGAALGQLRLGGGFEDTGSIEVLDLELLHEYRAHRTIQAVTTDSRSFSEPLVHKGF